MNRRKNSHHYLVQNTITKAITLTFCLCLYFNNYIHAQKNIFLQEEIENYVLQGDFLEVCEDKKQQLTIDQVSAPNFKGFTATGNSIGHNKNNQSAYWLKFTITAKDPLQKKIILESYSPHSNLIQVFFQSSNGKYSMQEGGENFPFSKRVYVTKNLLFDLPLNKDQSSTQFYIRIVSKNYSAFDFRIKTINYFLYYITNEYFFLGLYYGILIIMAVYNILIFLSGKESVYLYYVLYVASSAVLTMTDDGLGFQLLWPNHPALGRPIGYTIAPIALMVFFIFYASSFLNLKKQFNTLWKILYVITGSYLIYFTFSIIYFGEALPIIYTIPFIAAFVIACICFYKGYRASRFFIIGYSFILISIILIQLRAQHIIEGNIFTVYSLNIGLIFEVVIFSFALTDRIKFIKKEQKNAQQIIIETLQINKNLQEKVNRELEEKVKERTLELSSKNKELEEVNLKLFTLNETINKINAGLDYDNWYLKKDIKSDLQARILEEEVGFEEFQKIFPNDLACMKFLAEQKWGDFFRCKKCGNLKYTESVDKTKRKCTVCGFVESSTAYTLYHGVRFPLTIAFYLTYLFFKKETGRNLSELSEMLSIRRNTCGKFRAKVVESKLEFTRLNKNTVIKSWEDLIILKKKK